MEQFEYMVISFPVSSLQAQLNQFGADGWKLIYAAERHQINTVYCIFMRRIPQADAPTPTKKPKTK